MNKNILLVSYTFPPFPGIGGRRWAKFAKELSKRNFEVYVIAAKNPFKILSPWVNDVERSNIHITYLPLKYPSSLIQTPPDLWTKINYKVGLFYVKLFSKGNYYDRAVLWKKQVLREASKLIEKNQIKNVIVSGAPFHLIHHVLELKNNYPFLKVIADFRDPWTTNHAYMGFSELSEVRKNDERMMEKNVVNNADLVVSVSEEMTNYFRLLEGKNADKFITIPNGFDSEDYKDSSLSVKKSDDKIRFLLTGTLYKNTETVFDAFINALLVLREKQPTIYHKLEFNFYGEAPAEYKIKVKNRNLEIIDFNHSVPLKEVYQKISETNFCMLFLQDHLNYSFSTKFYEYLAQKKKIVVFSKSGFTSEFVTKNKLGYWVSPENTYDDILEVVKKHESGEADAVTDFDINNYSVSHLTDELVFHLNKL